MLGSGPSGKTVARQKSGSGIVFDSSYGVMPLRLVFVIPYRKVVILIVILIVNLIVIRNHKAVNVNVISMML